MNLFRFVKLRSRYAKSSQKQRRKTTPIHPRLTLEQLETRVLLTSGLVAAYNFAQGSGSVLTDISGNGNNGTISNATWAAVNNSSVPLTGALQFAGGSNSYVTIANSASLDLSTGMTLEAWVDPTAAPKGWQDVMYKYHDNYYLETSSPSGAPAAGGTAGSTDTGPAAQNPLPTNSWSFLTATYNGTDMILYVNGVEVSSVAVSGNLATSTAPLQIGGDSNYGQYFQGLISNVRIYNTALTATEIQEDMNSPIASGTPPPTAPTNLTATASGTSINLKWGASSDTIGVSYAIDREAPGSSSFVQIATTMGTSYSDGGLAPNSAYTYKVQAVDWAGNQSAFSNTASATTGGGIAGLVAAYNFAQGSGSVLTDLSGNGNNGTISNATWTTVSNSSVPFTSALQFAGGSNSYVTIANSASLDLSTGMTLEAWVDPTAAPKGWQDVMYKYHDNYYLETSSPSGAPAAGGMAGSTDTGPAAQNPLPTNTWSFLTATYNGTDMILYVNGVQVSSVVVSGNLATSTAPLQIGGDSSYGQYFQGLISNVRIYNMALTANEIQQDMNTPFVPATPTGLKATAGNAQVALTWSASSGATSYDIYRSTTSGGEGTTPYKTGVASTSFTDTGLTNGTTYYYEVSAVNAAGQSPVSSQVSATPQVSAPPTPTGLTATAGNAQVALSWSASTGATSYDIYRSTTSGGEGSTPYTTGVTTTSFTDTGLTNGTTYYYEVSAVNAGGQSPVSSQVSATPQAASSLPLLPSSELASLQQQAANNTAQWQAFKANLDQHLNEVIGDGQGNDPGSYEGSELTWIADYALGYQVLKSSDPTTAAAYAGKAIALINSGLNDYQPGYWNAIQYLARGNGSTTTFTLPNSGLVSGSLSVYVVPVQTVAVVRGSSSTDSLGDYETILKVSNTSDGNPDYVGGTDWSTGAAAPGAGHDGSLRNNVIEWLSGGKHPAAGSTYYITETSGFTAWRNGPVSNYTLSGNTITFKTAPSAGQAVFVEYLYNTPSLQYQQTSAGDGGFNNVYIDTGYATRYLAYIPLGLDWLSGFSGLSPQLVSQAENILAQWSNYVSTSGYHNNAPGSNYGAGEYFLNAMTALYLDGRVSAGTQLMSNLLSWRQTYLLPVLQDTGTGGVNGGFWPEGWNYGWEASSDLILASVALEEGGYINAAPEHTWASQVVYSLISAQPAQDEVYDGGQWYNYPTRFMDKDLFYVLSATASDAAAQSYANYIVQNYPASDFIEGNNTDYNDAYNYQGMLFGNPSASASFWSSQPLQYFNSGSGLLTARSDWGSNPTWVSVQMGNFLTLDHQTLTPGQVQIQRGDDDLLANGTAVGQNSSFPWSNMGNIVIVNAGSAQSIPGRPGYWYGPQFNNPGVVVNAYEAAGNHTYFSGNLVASYNNDPSSGLANPVSQLTREVVYLNPNYVIVYDRVTTTQASYTKEQQWNFINAPSVTGNAFVESVGSSKLFGQAFSTTPLTLTVQSTQAGSATIQQLEIQNASPTASVNYLTAFQVAPSTTTSMDATEHVLTTDGRMEGTQMGNQLVLFGVASGTVDLTTSVTYSVSGSSSVSNLLVDLKAGGVYQVVAGGTNLGNVTASSQGTISFTTPAGAQQVTVTRVG